MTYPFKIIHLDIENLQYIFPSVEYGYYFVLWKGNIPLGDWYVDKGVVYNQDFFSNKIIEFTKQALEQYNASKLIKYKEPGFLIEKRADVSVVICTRNRSEDLRICLEHLKNQECLPLEIIVIDNAPSDDATEQLVKNYPEVKYHKEPRPGLDIARNTGARMAKSPIVAYMDDDVKPHPQWIFHVKESFDDPAVMAMTGLVIAAELETESQQIFEKHWSFNRGYHDKYYNKQFFSAHLLNGPPVWEIGAGANMAFRKCIFDQVGYFDERLDVGAAGCNGDSEMWFRILSKNGTIHYNPRAVSFHHHRKEIKQLKKQIFYYMRGFAAAALIQQREDTSVNYSRHLFNKLPKFYVKKAIKHFPFYRSRYTTLFKEIGGLASGILYYVQHKNQKP